MGLLTRTPNTTHIGFVLVIVCLIPILQGEEQSSCPSLADNPICPCYNFKEGLFLECPSATPLAVKNILSKIRGSIQSLSIYDLESSTTELKADLFPPKIKIIGLQISQTGINNIDPNAFISLRDSLESLSIVSSKLNKIPHESLLELYNIEGLDLQLNDIEEIPANTFKNLKLKKLNLKGNKVVNISENAFFNLGAHLTELDLTENFLNEFPLKALGKLNRIANLRLAWNKILSIPNDVGVVLPTLSSIDLSSNLLTKIDKDCFRSMPNIKILTLFNNKIEEINEQGFQYLEFLESLDLSRNKIVTLFRNTFKNNKNIRTIDLNYNHLHYITGVFSNLHNVSEIFLSENNILEISDEDFKNSDSLTVLNLEHNAIRKLDENCFTSLRNLTQLHMGTNFLKKLPRNLFKNNSRLVTLSLDNNEINELDELIFDNLVTLREVRLQNNRIFHIRRNVFSPLPGLLELHLQNNVIQTIDSHAFITLRNLQHINLQGNRLSTIGDVFPNRNSSIVSINIGVNSLSLLKNSSLRGQINVHIMWLSQNNLKSLTSNLFNDLLSIQRLYVKSNNIIQIENKTFMQLKKLRYLDLSDNKITKLTNETFYKLVTLEELILQSNMIKEIAKDTFTYLHKLKILDLSQNEITTLQFDISKLPIKQIRLNKNLISTIKVGTLNTLPNLNDLEMNNNLLTSEDIMQVQISGLKSLVISINNFFLLENKTFSHLPSLQTLALENSNISHLPSTTFIKNQNLLRINLAFNSLKDLHKDVFAYTTILQELNLRGNNFTEFPHVALFNVTSLEILDLCHNQLHSIDFFKFIGLQNLRYLSLCNNRISVLNGFNSPSLKNLVTLNLSNNMLTVLPPNFFQHSVGLKEIDMSFNLFKHIPSIALSETVLPALKILNMTSNYLVQLLETYPTKQFPLLEELKVSDTNLTIITSKDFENFPSLKKLILTRNSIVRLSPGAFLKLNSLDLLDLSSNKLENIPRERLQGLYLTRTLNISYNTIKELEEFTSDMSNLQKLDASFNHITRINKDIFSGLQSLTELYLSGNWLSTISTDAFRNLNKITHIDLSRNYFETVQMKMLLYFETQIRTISFDENPLTCDCDSQDVWRWMQDHYKIILKGSKNLRCEHPEDLHGYSFLALSSQKLCDSPIVVRIAIQDIQTYSVVVSWQSRNQSGLNGYQVAYYGEQNPTVRGKILNATARSTRLNHLTPGAKYTICVLAIGNFGIPATSTDSFTPDARISLSPNNSTFHVFGDEQVFTNIRSYMNDSLTSKCTTVNTIEIFGASIDSPFSNTYMGIADMLTRRLSLVVGCCMGFIVFVVLVVALGYIKSTKRPVVTKTEVQEAPQYISYDNFSATGVADGCQSTEIDINTISDKTKQ